MLWDYFFIIAQNSYIFSTLFATWYLDKQVICDRIMLSNQKGIFYYGN